MNRARPTRSLHSSRSSSPSPSSCSTPTTCTCTGSRPIRVEQPPTRARQGTHIKARRRSIMPVSGCAAGDESSLAGRVCSFGRRLSCDTRFGVPQAGRRGRQQAHSRRGLRRTARDRRRSQRRPQFAYFLTGDRLAGAAAFLTSAIFFFAAFSTSAALVCTAVVKPATSFFADRLIAPSLRSALSVAASTSALTLAWVRFTALLAAATSFFADALTSASLASACTATSSTFFWALTTARLTRASVVATVAFAASASAPSLRTIFSRSPTVRSGGRRAVVLRLAIEVLPIRELQLDKVSAARRPSRCASAIPHQRRVGASPPEEPTSTVARHVGTGAAALAQEARSDVVRFDDAGEAAQLGAH